MAVKSYGTLLKKGSTTVGEIISTGVPEIKAEKAETTNHSSGGWRTYIPAGLKELGEFELTLNASGSLVASLYADMAAETVTAYTVSYPTATSGSLTDWSFLAFPTSVKIQEAKAEKPDSIQVKVKWQASGSITIA
jgi:hypothetical protein